MSIRVAITDDHPVVTNGLSKILSEFSSIAVVGAYANGKDLLDNISESQPDVLLLDMHLPDLEGPELAKRLLKIYPQLSILVLTSVDVLVQVKKMLQIGCKGYLLKDSDDVTIVAAIETVYKGGQFLSPVLQQRIMEDMFKGGTRKNQTTLTQREKEVLQLISDEFTSQEIAAKLFISPHTVENHRISLMGKLNAKNTAGLVRKAIEFGLIE